ncbi:MAG: VWA domain-containing protein [Atopobiaceae bacterium]|nr:VWA domain-containing protein [Atopobiaceae bacterium]
MGARSGLRRLWMLVAVLACATLWIAGATQAWAITDGNPVVVSMGDSYSSGEGTEPFYGQNGSDKYADVDWLAHRSEKAWSGQLKLHSKTLKDIRNDGWYFTAVSGAECRHILSDTQHKDYEKDAFHSGGVDLPCQSNVFVNEGLSGKVDYVTLTIGGNDVDFVGVVTSAALDGKYVRLGGLSKKLRSSLDKFKKQTKSDIMKTYNHVLDKAGSQATLVVAGYPHLVPPTGRFAWCREDEATLINAAVDTFDTQIKEMVATCGKSGVEFVDVRGEFAGHEEQYINNVEIGANDQDLMRFHLTHNQASAYSVHPNADGQAAYARAVQRKIDDLEKRVGAPVSSDVAMSLVFDVSGSMDDPSALSGESKLDAAKRQSRDFVSSVGGEDGPGGMSVKVGVASFATYAESNCGLSNDPEQVRATIDGLTASGRTNIYDGLVEGIGQVKGESGPKLIVFLSDGKSNEGGSETDILNLAHEAADMGIKIYTIGFGPSGDLDEHLLQQMAEITGGLYSHEDSSNIGSAAVGLFAQMMYAQLVNTSTVLIDGTGTVRLDGLTDVGKFLVDANGTVTAYLYWPGSVLDLHLTDPDGVLVEEGYAGCSIDTSSIPTRITIENAKQGEWGMAVYGRETSMDEEPFYAVAAFDETTAPAVASVPSGGGAASDSSAPLLFLLVAVAIAGITLVFAASRGKE